MPKTSGLKILACFKPRAREGRDGMETITR